MMFNRTATANRVVRVTLIYVVFASAVFFLGPHINSVNREMPVLEYMLSGQNKSNFFFWAQNQGGIISEPSDILPQKFLATKT